MEILLDEFRGNANAPLAAHTPNQGAWTVDGASPILLDGKGSTQWSNAGGIFRDDAGAATPAAWSTVLVSPAALSVLFQLTNYGGGAGDGATGISAGPDTGAYYSLFYNQTAMLWQLLQITDGIPAPLGTLGGEISPGATVSALFEVSGADLYVRLSTGDTLHVTADPEITDPCVVGVQLHNNPQATASEGLHLRQVLILSTLLVPIPP